MNRPAPAPAINDPDANRDIEHALDLLFGIKMTHTSALKLINAHANAAHKAGNRDLERALTRQAVELSRQNLALANARRKIMLAQSLAIPIARLQTLAAEVDAARQRLEDIAQALQAAGQLINILRQLLGIFA